MVIGYTFRQKVLWNQQFCTKWLSTMTGDAGVSASAKPLKGGFKYSPTTQFTLTKCTTNLSLLVAWQNDYVDILERDMEILVHIWVLVLVCCCLLVVGHLLLSVTRCLLLVTAGSAAKPGAENQERPTLPHAHICKTTPHSCLRMCAPEW